MTSKKLIACLFALLLLFGTQAPGFAANKVLDPSSVEATLIASTGLGGEGSSAHLNASKASNIADGDAFVDRLSFGGSHSALIDNDGSLWLWGSNDQGQLGDGTMSDRLSPVKVMGNVKKVSLGVYHSAALKNDGSLWLWGQNISGQLGDGTNANAFEPVKVMDDVVDVALGYDHSAAVKKDGTLYTWGSNNCGQLGDGTTQDRNKPVKVLTGVASVSLGATHSAALKSDGTMYAWGSNLDGAIGDGTNKDRQTPVKILSNVRAIELGYYHSAAITQSNELLTWGQNFHGELGDNLGERRNKPKKVLDGVAQVSLGGSHSLALTVDGNLLSWGWNSFGEVGNGSRIETFRPNTIMKNVAGISAGTYHSGAVTDDGVLLVWGRNEFGELGDGTRQSKTRPKEIWTGLKAGGGGDSQSKPNPPSGGSDDNPSQPPEGNGSPEEEDGPQHPQHPPIPVAKIVIPTVKTLTVGQKGMTLSIIVYPETADNTSVSWSSSNSSVVSVDSVSGVLTPRGSGSATVKATAKDGSGVSASCKITVKDLDVKISSVSIPDTMSMTVGDIDDIPVTVRPSNASNKTLSWTTSNSNIVAVSSTGKIKAKKMGTAVITVRTLDGSGKKDTCKVIVSEIKIASIQVESPVNMEIGERRTLSFKIKPEKAENNNIRWTSSSPATVSINSATGMLNAKKAGTVTVTATALDGSGVKGTARVTVKGNVKVQKITLPSTHSMKVSTSKTLVHSVSPSNATDKSVKWVSSNPSVVTVHASTGKMTAKRVGVAIVTVKAKDGSGTRANCKVSVSAVGTGSSVSVKSVVLPSIYRIKVGGSAVLKATVKPANASHAKVKWTSSNPSVVSINASTGRITAKRRGVATITATAADGSGKKGTCRVTVTGS